MSHIKTTVEIIAPHHAAISVTGAAIDFLYLFNIGSG
jgi:hypothetical protein